MKPGLDHVLPVHIVSRNRCPDAEGIETSSIIPSLSEASCRNRCPDAEGIETEVDEHHEKISMRCSRCPDAEGIET